jgi:hypothetical protein
MSHELLFPYITTAALSTFKRGSPVRRISRTITLCAEGRDCVEFCLLACYVFKFCMQVAKCMAPRALPFPWCCQSPNLLLDLSCSRILPYELQLHVVQRESNLSCVAILKMDIVYSPETQACLRIAQCYSPEERTITLFSSSCFPHLFSFLCFSFFVHPHSVPTTLTICFSLFILSLLSFHISYLFPITYFLASVLSFSMFHPFFLSFISSFPNLCFVSHLILFFKLSSFLSCPLSFFFIWSCFCFFCYVYAKYYNLVSM